MGMHVKKGDRVMVISGKSKGSIGEVLKVMPQEDRILVKGVNVRTKNIRRSQHNPQGGQVQQEMPIHISNVQPVNSKDQPTRVKFVTKEDGSKVRVAVKGGDELHVLKQVRH